MGQCPFKSVCVDIPHFTCFLIFILLDIRITFMDTGSIRPKFHTCVALFVPMPYFFTTEQAFIDLHNARKFNILKLFVHVFYNHFSDKIFPGHCLIFVKYSSFCYTYPQRIPKKMSTDKFRNI